LNIARLRLANQRLVDRPFDNPADVVRWLGALQSQDYPNAKWGIAQRMRSATNRALDAAFNAGEIVRLHALRPTWHFIAADDLHWILALTSPRVQAANARVYRNLELDDVVLNKAHGIFARALEGGRSLTRAELGKALASKRIAATGQRLAYVAMHAELDGVICSGPMRGNAHTYALVDERVRSGRVIKGDEALAELASRYFTSHGPATAHDFAWWSGLTIAEAKRAAQMIERELTAVSVDGKTYWLPSATPAKVKPPVVHLLPNYDEHVVAYRDHGPSLDPRTPDALRGWGNGLTTHMICLNGLVVGGWRRTIAADHVALRLALPIRLSAPEATALKRAIKRYGEFIELPVEHDLARV
jgi:hypothetical protein